MSEDPLPNRPKRSPSHAVVDKDGPPLAQAGLFGLDFSRRSARVIALFAPFEATVSYRAGTAGAPEAIRIASHQIDLFDLDVGDLEQTRIHLHPTSTVIAEHNAHARPLAEKVLSSLSDASAVADPSWLPVVNERCRLVHDILKSECAHVLAENKIPCVVGGDHSVAFGPICAALEFDAQPLGILQVDAHADLRDAYEGFTYSHASVMHNVLRQASDDVREQPTLVQFGIRDVSESEVRVASDDRRITMVSDRMLRAARLRGGVVGIFRNNIDRLPHRVWLSIDIDGLDPALCPHTGTPVPGGLSFDELVQLLEEIVDSGREIIGMDLCEVAPGPKDAPNFEWDAMVGARVLAKMCGFAVRSQRGQTP